MAAKKDKMIPSEKERKRALKYATPAGTGRMWVTMGIAFIIFGMDIYILHGGRHASTRWAAMPRTTNCLRSTNL